jgi:hypothetical protein
MAEKWELDTFLELNNLRLQQKLKSLVWSAELEEEVRHYILTLPIFEYDWEDIGSMIQDRNDEKFDYKIEQKEKWIKVLPEYGGGTFIDSSFGGPDPQCSRKYKPSKFRHSMNIKHLDRVIGSCRCPHWTPPKQIAELLWMKSLEHTTISLGAIAIYNDDVFSYVALACT